MDPAQGEGRGASEQPTTVGQMTTTTAGQGAGLGVVQGDTAYSTTTVSTGVDPATGQPTTTYKTYTVGAVPTSSYDGMTAGYATYQTYTATAVHVASVAVPALQVVGDFHAVRAFRRARQIATKAALAGAPHPRNVGVPVDTVPAVGGGDVGIEDISGGGDVSGSSMGGGFDEGGGSQLASDIEMSGNIGAGMGGGMGTVGGDDDVGGLAGGVMGGIGGEECDTGGMGSGI